MDWARHGPTWPHCEHSRFVHVAPHVWHVQEMGAGPVVLLIHGAGASTHSWRGLMPLLAAEHRVLALDLPGQGFTRLGSRRRFRLDAMAEDIAALLRHEQVAPEVVIGHSAGAALALRLVDLLPRAPRRIVGINAALENFHGPAGLIFPALAKILAANPLTAWFFSGAASSGNGVRRILDGTGSRVDAEGLRLYRALIGDRGHVDATLSMMANWSLDDLLPRLPQIEVPVLFLAGERDRTVPPEVSRKAAARMPHARYVGLPALGHLAHEEDPAAVATAIAGWRP